MLTWVLGDDMGTWLFGGATPNSSPASKLVGVGHPANSAECAWDAPTWVSPAKVQQPLGTAVRPLAVVDVAGPLPAAPALAHLRQARSAHVAPQPLVLPDMGISELEALLRGVRVLRRPVSSNAAMVWERLEEKLFLESKGGIRLWSHAPQRRVETGGALSSSFYEITSKRVNGRVSIVMPLPFHVSGDHEELWNCFEAQKWDDKELVVVETFRDEPSTFLQKKARQDKRLVHVCLHTDRNLDGVDIEQVGILIASGEFVSVCPSENVLLARSLGLSLKAFSSPQTRDAALQ